jgi:carbonic anhydrase
MWAMANTSPAQAWTALKKGNDRFVAGSPEHPSQSIEHRASLAVAQRPTAVVFGCADSRVAAEIIFDQGLGDMFVVRTAGHVIDSAVLGSIEYAVTVLAVPLIVVLGHDSCGAVQATLDALDNGQVPGGFVRDVVERVTPSIMLGRREGLTRVDEFETRHVIETGSQLLARSAAIANRVGSGELAIVGLTYRLADGRITLREHLGDIGESQGESRAESRAEPGMSA